MRRWILAVGLALAWNGWLISPEGHAQRGGSTSLDREDEAGPDVLRPYGSRETRASVARKPTAYTRSTSAPPVEKKPRPAATFGTGARDYYSTARPNQSPNRNVVNTRTLCNPGRRALLQP